MDGSLMSLSYGNKNAYISIACLFLHLFKNFMENEQSRLNKLFDTMPIIDTPFILSNRILKWFRIGDQGRDSRDLFELTLLSAPLHTNRLFASILGHRDLLLI